MNKWITLIGTLAMTVVFSATIGTTMANPSGANVGISAALVAFIIVGLWVFYKSGKKEKPVKEYDGLEPAN